MKFLGSLDRQVYELMGTPRKLAEIEALAAQATGQEKEVIGQLIEGYRYAHGPDNMYQENPQWEEFKRKNPL